MNVQLPSGHSPLFKPPRREIRLPARSPVFRLILAAGFAMLAAGLAAWLWPATGRAQGSTPATLPAADRARIDAVFQDFNDRTPGCVLGVVRDGRLAYARGYGMASLEENVPMTPETVLEIGSVSKQFTATSIFLLEHDGKLSIDDEARKYIHELPDYRYPVTIRELLHHTSGVRDCIALMEMSGIPFDDYATEADALAMIARQKELNFEPNTAYLYSNSGYFLLSRIVKRVSGMPLAQFARERIFQPLGMIHTTIVDDHTLVIPGRSRTYAPWDGGGYQVDVSNWEQTGDGAVDTTVGDLALWDRNFDDPVVGGRRLIDELETQGVLKDGKKIDYAAGLAIDTYRGLRRVSHAGSWQGFRAQFERFPDQELSLITLCNVANADPGARTSKVADILLGDKLAPAPSRTRIALGDDKLRRYAGLYWSERDHDVRRVDFREHKLFLQQGLAPARELAPFADDEFGLGDATVRFRASGGHTRMILEAAGETLDRYPPAHPTAGQTQPLAGRYRSDELQVTWTIDAQGGKLALRALGANPNRLDTDKSYTMIPAVPGVFTAGPYVVQVDSQGFRASIGRAGGIRFLRESR
ncbi:MAG TPA: serine hydrolase domain-containing protein [Candidatus Acidoferrales bacterium]|nr:serine hydrolase domain-containing protein [Candidatus Acidoferrales bacterium]